MSERGEGESVRLALEPARWQREVTRRRGRWEGRTSLWCRLIPTAPRQVPHAHAPKRASLRPSRDCGSCLMSGSERPIASMPWMARFEMIGLASTAQSASTACAMAFRPEVTCEREGVRVSGASSQTDTRFDEEKKTHRHLWRERQGQVDVVDDGLGEHLRARERRGTSGSVPLPRILPSTFRSESAPCSSSASS